MFKIIMWYKEKEYKILKLLGNGAFGQVFLV